MRRCRSSTGEFSHDGALGSSGSMGASAERQEGRDYWGPGPFKSRPDKPLLHDDRRPPSCLTNSHLRQNRGTAAALLVPSVTAQKEQQLRGCADAV